MKQAHKMGQELYNGHPKDKDQKMQKNKLTKMN
jgi:hypothetical protein